jgi:hypothetical protein
MTPQEISAAAEFIDRSGALIEAAEAAVHALRSYQYGNQSTELAREIADALDAALKPAQQALLKALSVIK